jgi:hypothetical protein
MSCYVITAALIFDLTHACYMSRQPHNLKCAGHVACIVQVINAYKILVRKSEGKRPRGRRRRRWEDNIRMDLREVGWEDVDWICLAQDRDQWRVLVNTVINLRVS